MHITILLILAFQTHLSSGIDCSFGEASCQKCVYTSSECFWCNSLTENRCQSFRDSNYAQYICPNIWVHQDIDQCPHKTANTETDSSKIDQMLQLLKTLKSQNNVEPAENDQSASASSENLNDIIAQSLKDSSTPESGTAVASSADLKELLHKLLLLKLLRKVKNEGSATLSDGDKLLLYELSSKTTTTTTTTKPPLTESNVNIELSQLLEILKNEAAETSKGLISQEEKDLDKVSPKVNINKTLILMTHPPTTLTSSNKTFLTSKPPPLVNNHNENVEIDYEETDAESLENLKVKNKVENTEEKTETVVTGYCSLYKDTVLCNKDSNCTWCNPTDVCIQRNDHAYQQCVKTSKKEFGIDPCFSLKHCKQCVNDNKCYWCDLSKSCHTYPFYDFVPTSCGGPGDWYVKQCDVQLAVIIIVLPLIMILLAMVTFYFCLKYCYYKRKVLRVPLFEKPGVFDYRKDKKVYFVHPDDESSENEMEVEKFRKKYRLPMEREPLIDPNS